MSGHTLFLYEGKVNIMEQSNQFLGTEHIGKLMRKYAIPCIISLLVLLMRIIFGIFNIKSFQNWLKRDQV